MHKFRFLKYGLGLVLVFVGRKSVCLNEALGGKFPVTWSLGILGFLLVAAVAASLAIPLRPAAVSPPATA